MNLNNLKDLNEKLLYLMLNKYADLETRLSDKYIVREYIKEKGYENILPKLYGAYNFVDEIDFNNLPNQFVIKTNNGSVNVQVCLNKNKFNIEKYKKKYINL